MRVVGSNETISAPAALLVLPWRMRFRIEKNRHVRFTFRYKEEPFGCPNDWRV